MNTLFRQKQHLFWSADLKQLDAIKHQSYIVHQVLQYGDLKDFYWLKKLYSEAEIKAVFLNKPRATYSPRTFAFVKDFLLKIRQPIKTENYVTTSF